MADIKLKHRSFTGSSQLYFYDGSVPIRNGVVKIPSGRKEWAANAYLRGYEYDAETGRHLTPGEIDRKVRETPKVL